MHTLNLILLLLGAIVVMRAVSWLLGWVLCRLWKRTVRCALLAANLLALAIFVGFLAADWEPGEPMDYDELIFGGGVYAVFFLLDLMWVPWKRPQRGGPPPQEPGA
jgi:hypothetical protein